jgi:hypothetical protein
MPSHVVDGGLVGGVYHQQRPVRGTRKRRTDSLEPLRRPSGEADAHVRRRVLSQVEGHEPTNEPGGAEHDKVELAVLRRRAQLSTSLVVKRAHASVRNTAA